MKRSAPKRLPDLLVSRNIPLIEPSTPAQDLAWGMGGRARGAALTSVQRIQCFDELFKGFVLAVLIFVRMSNLQPCAPPLPSAEWLGLRKRLQ